MYRVRITAPAKVNLGLEILGRRDDGYHEIATVMAMVDLCDVIELSPDDGNGFKRASVIPDVRLDEDLAVRALQTAKLHVRRSCEDMSIQVEKHIPVAAGLGGASSDAAAVLVSANRVWGQCMDQDQLHREAASLGSDVPFFLTGPCAIATGTGTDLEPLPRPRGWLLIVTPPFSLPEKTRAMYAALQPGDYTDGARAASVAWALRAGRMPDPADLHNAFARPLYELAPDLARIPEILRQHGAELAALSGAGPSHYGWFRDAAGARGAIGQMARRLPKKTRLDVAPFSSLRLEDRLTVSPT